VVSVVSGAIHDPEVYFEAPPSASVPAEMSRLIHGFDRSAPGNAEPLPALM
jgi:hypothetical protein